jgi:hypothetical protein
VEHLEKLISSAVVPTGNIICSGKYNVIFFSWPAHVNKYKIIRTVTTRSHLAGTAAKYEMYPSALLSHEE